MTAADRPLCEVVFYASLPEVCFWPQNRFEVDQFIARVEQVNQDFFWDNDNLQIAISDHYVPSWSEEPSAEDEVLRVAMEFLKRIYHTHPPRRYSSVDLNCLLRYLDFPLLKGERDRAAPVIGLLRTLEDSTAIEATIIQVIKAEGSQIAYG